VGYLQENRHFRTATMSIVTLKRIHRKDLDLDGGRRLIRVLIICADTWQRALSLRSGGGDILVRIQVVAVEVVAWLGSGETEVRLIVTNDV
jgi:hypothetical protein